MPAFFNPGNSGGPVNDNMQDVYFWIFWVSVVVGVLVSVALIYGFIRFRRRSDDEEPEQVHGSNRLEVAWTVVPFIILMALFVLSANKMEFIRQAPAPGTGKAAIHVTVIAERFDWIYDYTGEHTAKGGDVRVLADSIPGEAAPVSILHVPVDTPIVLHIVSFDPLGSPGNPLCASDPTGPSDAAHRLKADIAQMQAKLKAGDADAVPDELQLATAISNQGCGVNHSFYIPSLAGQMNAIPGQVNYLWFQAREGMYYGQCTELCGEGHAIMLLAVKATSQADYDTWLMEQVTK